MKHKICHVEKKSICDELGVKAGDFLISLNAQPITDCIDYRYAVSSENIFVEVETADGEVWELDIEKETHECLGLVFCEPLMSPLILCRNKCVFCFVDQEPPGLRDTLYVKDDDYRHSFFHGNFITLTNMAKDEARRIAKLHLSPLRISVHSTRLDVRKKIMGSEGAGNLLEILDIFNEAKISMHFQIVLCKGLNDGVVLDETIIKLAGYRHAESLAIVPVGLTKHREGLYVLSEFSADDCVNVIRQVEMVKKSLQKRPKTNFVFLSDEWYIKAEMAIPHHKSYGNYPQLSNGVGMARLFRNDFLNQLENLPSSNKKNSASVITGELAYTFIKELMYIFCKKFKAVAVKVHKVKNTFYGESITVSGLLTGGDVMAQVKKNASIIFMPTNAFREGSSEMIDGTTLKELQSGFNAKVVVGSDDGGLFAMQLYRELLC